MPQIVIPQSRTAIERQIRALKYALSMDTREMDRQIHKQALRDLERALGELDE